MPKLILLSSAILLVLFTAAQQPKQYSFTHYTTNAGLLSNQVNAVVQDADGYIWAGTTDGLQRFDGTRYKTFRYKENDFSGIPSSPVWQLLMDKKKNLWVLMSDGKVGIFNTRTFVFKEVPAHFKKPVTPNTYLKRLLADEFGHVFYLLSGSEVITLDEKKNEFSYTHNFFKQKEDWDIIDFIQQPGTRKYWFSTKNAGLAVYDSDSDVMSYPSYYNSEVFNNLYFDKQQRLWTNTSGPIPYIQCYDLKSNRQVLKNVTLGGALKTYHLIKRFFQQNDGTIWVHGLQVLAKYNEPEKQFQLVYNGYVNERSIAYEMVHCLFEDREKNIWVGTDNNGLYRFNPATEFFNNIKHTNPSDLTTGKGNAMSFVSTKWGTVLAGTWGDGLYEYNKAFNAIPINIKGLGGKINPYIWCMIASADSNSIWMTAQPGIYLINQKDRSGKYYNPPQLNNGTVSQIAEDKKGNLWLGMNKTGVFKWTANNGQHKFEEGISSFPSIPPVQVNKLLVDSKGYVWVGTPENGIYVIDPDANKIASRFSDTSANDKKLPERGVSSILEYNDSLIIVTTATRVVCYNRMLHRSRIIGPQGAISGFITAVEKDKEGDLWLTSTSGLYRIDIPGNLIVKFGRADGIDNEHFIQSASYKLPDGKLMFGTTNDIIVFDPARIKITSATPDIQITDIKIMGKYQPLDSLMRQEEINLDYKDNALTIEFSPLTYNSPSFIKYKLEGLDKNWKPSDKNNEAIYSYVPPGNYTFFIKAINEEGKESAKITQLKITVRPPFWKTWWFYSLLALIAATLFFWYDRERMKRKEAVQKIRSDIADNLYQEVNTTLGNINILSEMAKLKADKDPEKSKDYIQQINTKSQQMIVSMDDMLWGISPENDSMPKTLERFKEHIDMIRNRNQVQIDLLVDKNVEELKLNMKVRQNVFWFLKSGITNMVKTGATKVKLFITIEKSHLLYTLEFDNSNIDMQQLNNILQRQELAKKMQEVNGRLSIQHQTTISLIQLSIPV